MLQTDDKQMTHFDISHTIATFGWKLTETEPGHPHITNGYQFLGYVSR